MWGVVSLGAGEGIGGQLARIVQVRRRKYAGTAFFMVVVVVVVVDTGRQSAVIAGRGGTGRQTAGMPHTRYQPTPTLTLTPRTYQPAVFVGSPDTGRKTAGIRPGGDKDEDEDENEDEEEHVVGDLKG